MGRLGRPRPRSTSPIPSPGRRSPSSSTACARDHDHRLVHDRPVRHARRHRRARHRRAHRDCGGRFVRLGMPQPTCCLSTMRRSVSSHGIDQRREGRTGAHRDTVRFGDRRHPHARPGATTCCRAAKGLDTGSTSTSSCCSPRPAVASPSRSRSRGRAAARRPPCRSTGKGRTDADLTITNPTPGTPFWVGLGQSHNAGWTASADGRGPRRPATRRRVRQRLAHLDTVGHRSRAPQLGTTAARVDRALALSSLGAVLCLVLAFRRPGGVALAVDDPQPETITWKTFARSHGRDEPGIANPR